MSIQLLDEITINKIAAGEVIDRPASVVKELVENSIDANATRIEITLLDGGRKRIKITDNGHGITKEDLPLAPLRHSTSKIHSLEDVYLDAHFGFRGEALASMCHVSHMTIQSKTEGQDAFEITAFQGDISQPALCSHPQGTTIDLQDLFLKVPVRRNYLKSAGTELSHVLSILTPLSLIHSDIDFVLIHEGQEKLNTTGIKSLKLLIHHFYGKKISESLLKIDEKIGPMHFKGYISNPMVTFPNRNKQLFSVNARYIKSALLQKACSIAMKDYIPHNRFPFLICDIDIDPAGIDVNIHPQKQDIKFLDPGFLFDALPKVLKPLFSSSHFAEQTGLSTQTPPVRQFFNPSNTEFTVHTPVGTIPSTLEQAPMPTATQIQTLYEPLEIDPAVNQPISYEYFQIFDTYIALKTNEGLTLLDQHAVHERILYEKFKVQFGDIQAQQPLLITEVFDVSADLYLIFESNQQILKEMLFDCEAFGLNQISVRAVPSVFVKANIPELITDILEQYKEAPNSIRDLTLDQKEALQMKACKAAIKAGLKLKPEEVERLIQDFISSPSNFTCPHGRPLALSFNKAKLEALFLRT